MRTGVQKIYSEVADHYEFINHLLTFGLDMRWRKKAAREAAGINGTYWLDVCSGTGEMAENLLLQADHSVKIISVDFSYPMLIRAKKKAASGCISFALAEASALPFPKETFDLISISFATRNINQREDILMANLKEFHRVLKPGGFFLNLETSQPAFPIIRKLFHLYVKIGVKRIGALLSGSQAGYSYLSYTIPRFYSAPEFSKMLFETGFSHVNCHPLFLSIAAIHMAQK